MISQGRRASPRAWSARSRAPPASDYDVRKAFPYLGYETYDFDVPTAHRGRRLRALPGARRRDAREREDLPAGARAHHADRASAACDDPRIVPPPKDRGLHRDGSADSALPDLLAGLHRAGRRGLRAGRRAARRARLLRRVRRHQPAVAGQDAAAVVPGLPGAADDRSRRPDRRRRSPSSARSTS